MVGYKELSGFLMVMTRSRHATSLILSLLEKRD